MSLLLDLILVFVSAAFFWYGAAMVSTGWVTLNNGYKAEARFKIIVSVLGFLVATTLLYLACR